MILPRWAVYLHVPNSNRHNAVSYPILAIVVQPGLPLLFVVPIVNLENWLIVSLCFPTTLFRWSHLARGLCSCVCVYSSVLFIKDNCVVGSFNHSVANASLMTYYISVQFSLMVNGMMTNCHISLDALNIISGKLISDIIWFSCLLTDSEWWWTIE